jgi:hypothetical protein
MECQLLFAFISNRVCGNSLLYGLIHGLPFASRDWPPYQRQKVCIKCFERSWFMFILTPERRSHGLLLLREAASSAAYLQVARAITGVESHRKGRDRAAGIKASIEGEFR